ncbi:hypothetical protein C8J55DRAFT_510158 [Lentinula edodes]|uniref:Uncharacterized protein n=1 Tax=Lentinula lateritia TaxID=40482 RepID=A0A9W9DSZ0_9AGAR|nr:hypothetical protein C8J55DRAFT_510153 [Lentinula edodes]KAJ4484262.1 hypothetical protein C8J55DRAFT_510158 [Lentinula edodes]
MILCSDLDAAILSLLEDERSRPLVDSPTPQTGSCTSHFATSNEDPGSRKRRRLRDSLGEEVPVEVVRPRVAQANPFDPRPDCNRNGASASRKRPRVNHLLNLDFGEEEEQRGGEEENMGPQFLYEASDRPHAPPKEVTDASLGLMLRLTGGAGWGTDVWAEDIRCIVACVDWEEASGALSSYSLLHLAQRCSRAEKIDTGATFIRMMYELFLAAKVNSILHENSKDGAPLSSAYPAITSVVREGISRNNMHNWLNAGSRWGRLASAGSIYLLLIIAGQPGLASKLKSKAVSSTILFALCNDLRWPDNMLSTSFVTDRLVPAISKLQKLIPLQIPTLYSPTVQKRRNVPEILLCQDLVTSDRYFDSFHQRASFNLDRQQEIWEPILSFLPEEGEDPISFNELGTRYLTQSSGFEDFEALDLGLESDSDYLKKVEEISTLENQFASTYVGNSEEGTILRLKSWFREDSIPKTASKAISPENLEELAEKLKERYDKVSGKIRKNQKWLKVPQHLIAGREINLRDQEDKLIFHVDGTLSSEVRTNLFNSLRAWCQTASLSMSGANLKTTDSSSNTAFTALHFSYHAKYGVSGKNAPTNVHPNLLRRTEEKRTNTAQFHVYASTDMRRYPEPYELLCIALEDTLEYIANKTLVRLPDFFEGLEGEIDIVPLYDSTPGRPFRSIVINLNCATLAHKDQQDQKGCIVLVISSCSGGELCFFEPKLVLEMFNGDFVAFPSRRYTHFNLHYQGIRSSLVLHSDKDGESYKKDGNGWVHNDFVL